MPETFQAITVAIIAVVPGALYTYAYERQARGYEAPKAADRLVRLLAASVVMHAALAALTYDLYRRYVETGRFRSGAVNPLLVELAALGYVGLPTLVGFLIGSAQRHNWKWVRWFLGRQREPRAWDDLWNRKQNAIIRLKLQSGGWLAGLWGKLGADGSPPYAAGYGEEQDLFLPVAFAVDESTGAFLADSHGDVQRIASGGGLLIRWDQVEYLEYAEVKNG